MRAKWSYFLATAALCVLALLCVLFRGSGQRRYHQHLDAPAVTAPRPEVQPGELCTHLPIVSIQTGGQAMPGEIIRDEKGNKTGYSTAPDGKKTIQVSVAFYQKEGRWHRLSDEPDFSSAANIRIRGNSSREFDKKGYYLETLKENGEENKLPVLGMAPGEDWVLHGPFLDKTLMRNYMWYNLAGDCMDWAPNARFCEVVLDGKYQGVYVMVEAIARGDNSRVNITKTKKNTTFSSYIIRMDRPEADDLQHFEPFTNYTLQNSHYFMIEYPPLRKLTPEIATWIKDDFSAFEKALYSYDYDSKEYGYKSLIEVESFVDYWIFNEFTCNYDAGNISTYVYKDLNGRFKMAVWDFNNACDRYWHIYDSTGFQFQNNVWYRMLMKDEDFNEAIIKRYRELRKTILSEEYLFQYIDDTAAYLGEALERNDAVWGYAYGEEHDILRPAERNPRSYEEAVAQLKDFIAVRGRWMDEHIEIIRQYSHESKVKKFNH